MLRGKMELLRLALIALVAQGVSGVFFDKKPVEPENGRRRLRVQTNVEAQVESQVERSLEMFDLNWRFEEEGMSLSMSLSMSMSM